MTAELDMSEDEAALREAVSRALEDASPVEAFARGGEAAGLVARRQWTLAVEMGWPGLLVPEEAGGAGLGLRALAVLCEEMGRHLFCGPFVATAALGVALAERAPEALPGLLQGIASGEIVIAAAHVPPSGAWPEAGPSLELGGGRIRGSREMVEHFGLATHVLAVDSSLRDGIVALVAALLPKGPGIAARERQGLDPSCPVASLQIDARVPDDCNLLRLTMTAEEFDVLLAPVHVAIAAELTGVAQAALDGAVAYAKTRHQFGVPIGSFQAIKHKLADGFVALGNARLALRHAASAADPSSLAAARVLAAEAALKVAGDYIQIQGGMGISWESEAHLYLKRARRLAASFGDTGRFRHAMLDRFIAALDEAAAPTVPRPAFAASPSDTPRDLIR